MARRVQEEEQQAWELSEDIRRSSSPYGSSDERRHSSSASSSSQSTGNSAEARGSAGRRSRPSVSSASAALATVQEQREHRSMSFDMPERPADPRLASEETVVSSQDVLTNFEKVASRKPEQERRRREQLARYGAQNQGHRHVYERLRRWADTRSMPLKDRIKGLLFDEHKQQPLPSYQELIALAKHYYPPRGQLKVHVCDFGLGRAEHTEITLGEVEEYWQAKPDWVDVRWIHAPLGIGLAHSSIEDIFLHDGEKGRRFETTGRAGWPYPETEILNFRGQDNVQEMRDVYLLLKDLDGLDEQLEEHIWDGDKNSSFQSDVTWRAGHLGVSANYWTMAASDMPWQLSEGMTLGSQGPMEGLKPIGRHIERQLLSSHPFYAKSQLVRNPFRTFHRGDGFLLTLSPMAGVNYLDKNLSQYLSEPLDAMFDNDDASAVGHVFQAFAEKGTRTWHRRTTEWFLVYLLTEVGCTPHSIRQGFNAPPMENAYSVVVQDLKRRRFEPWVRNETVKLVRDYLNCVDELTTIRVILQSKVNLFQALLTDMKKFEMEDLKLCRKPDNPDGETASDRINFALSNVKSQHECMEKILIDAKSSMNALFQLRSIEQNELAIVSDSQNKAIIVFTGVTIIFLPLSFFTSYYGMNLTGIANTTLTENYFWKVCGSVALLIVLLVV
ncbi:MAG: hypothetical protein Q9191_005733, partial [Dirinaria sp. TL-2023a]